MVLSIGWKKFTRLPPEQKLGSQCYMGVSENMGTPKSSILIRFSIIIINHPFWGTRIFGDIHILKHNPQGIFQANLGCPPSHDACGKWRFFLGSPNKNVIILVILGGGTTQGIIQYQTLAGDT